MPIRRVLSGSVFRDPAFPLFEARIRDLKAKSARVSGLKVCLVGEIPKITLEITGLHDDAELMLRLKFFGLMVQNFLAFDKMGNS